MPDIRWPVPTWIVVGFFFGLIILAVLASSPWAQEHLRWLSSQKFYLLLGILLGLGLAVVCITVASALLPLITKNLPLELG
jgi:hypothetical protein